ncbi:hypothetical protein BDZ45DRAFT_305853 [Acephala macrosclerotiorum]|nr:hypothetical protein BDZ45DRAFT_305853 [Acephala macrosclerotiorum]
MSTLGTWAGKNIVCVGDYGRGRKTYPAKLFTKDQEQKFYEYKDKNGENNLFEFLSGTGSERNLRIDEFEPLIPLLLRILNSKDYPRLSIEDQSNAARRVLSISHYYGTSEDSWILQNLNTKVFVRSEAIAIKPEYIHGPDIEFLGFGEVVLSRICWAPYSISHELQFPCTRTRNMHKGVWEGHAFDITTVGRHEEEVKLKREEAE